MGQWQADEVALLRRLASSTSDEALGELLGRSRGAVRMKRFELRIPGRPKNHTSGSAHANWRGGNDTNYGMHWNKVIVPQVFERDNWLCQEPGCRVFSPTGSLIHAHHIVPRRLTMDDSLTNHVTLCDPHHKRQSAHRWRDVTPDHLDTLPAYQLALLRSAA